MAIFVRQMREMKQTYKVEGMTCNNCVKHVADALKGIAGISEVEIDLKGKEATISSLNRPTLKLLQESLPSKYTISENPSSIIEEKTVSKFTQLRPLFIVIAYVLVGALLLNSEMWYLNDIMLDFMGLFFIAFSLFKVLDIKGFAASFQMYDPLAKQINAYGLVYPFIEILLGVMLLTRWNLEVALVLTIIILGITTIGVTKSLLSKTKIKCACLGTALNLPMTEATFIENSLMILMSTAMLSAIYIG